MLASLQAGELLSHPSVTLERLEAAGGGEQLVHPLAREVVSVELTYVG